MGRQSDFWDAETMDLAMKEEREDRTVGRKLCPEIQATSTVKNPDQLRKKSSSLSHLWSLFRLSLRSLYLDMATWAAVGSKGFSADRSQQHASRNS